MGRREVLELETKTYSDCRYLSCKALGLSVRLCPAGATGRVDVVFLYNEGVDGFGVYRGPLPAGLHWADTSRDVVARLGEPSDKYGGGRVPVAISYETKGLDVSFKNKSWDDSENPL